MKTETMIRELEGVKTKFEGKHVGTGEVNIVRMCSDVQTKLEELSLSIKNKEFEITDGIKKVVDNYIHKNYYLRNNLPDAGYRFYYTVMNDLDLCDADRFAALNTMMGYNVGFSNFRAIDAYLWKKDFDLMDITCKNYKSEVEKAIKELGLDLDLSHWHYGDVTHYEYY